MSDRNRTVAQRFVEEIWNNGDLSSAPELLDSEFYMRTNQIEPVRGVEALSGVVGGLRAAFPEGRFAIDEEIAGDNAIVHRWTFRGVHRGEWIGIQGTGKQVEVTGTATSHFREGKMSEHFADWDALGMMQQIGAAPATSRAV